MTLLPDVRYACRLLRKDPWFTVVAALALGLGIGLNTTVFTFVNAVLIRGLPFDHAEQIVYLNTRNLTTNDDMGVSVADLRDWRAEVHSFEGLASFDETQMNVSDAGRPAERIRGADVSANTFSLLRANPDPPFYQPFRQRSFATTSLMVRSAGAPAMITSAVREAVRAVDQDQPVYELRTLEESIERQRWPYRVFGSMFAIFAIVALVLSAVGIYAVTSYAVTQRTSEIGVRMALGAQPRQVSWLILRSGLGQLAIGLTLGLLGAWSVTSVLQSLLVQTAATDLLTFATIAGLLSLVTLIACLIPALRATRLDPLKALNRN